MPTSPADALPRIFDTAGAAAYLMTSRDRVIDMIARGELIAADIGRPGNKRPTWRITRDALDAYLASRRTHPATLD